MHLCGSVKPQHLLCWFITGGLYHIVGYPQDRTAQSLLPDGVEFSVIEEMLVILEPSVNAATGSSHGTISCIIHNFCSGLDRKGDREN